MTRAMNLEMAQVQGDQLPTQGARKDLPRPPRRMARRVGAVIAGLLANVVLATATDLLLHATGVFAPMGQPMSDALFTLAAAYRIAYGVAGCYLTARLAPDRPMAHAVTLGGIGLAFSILGAVACWDQGPEFGPKWYPLVIIAIALPCAWAGGRLHARVSHGR